MQLFNNRFLNTDEIDRRTNVGTVEMRDIDGGGRVLTGYAAVFNSPSRDLGGFTETIRPGAFTEFLASGRNVHAYWNHNRDMILGSTQAGTLRLSENSRGLKYELDIPDTTHGRDLSVLVKRGDVRANSFAFTNTKDAWTKNGAKREILSADLVDISPVGDPAYLGAEIVSMRSKQEYEKHRGYDPDVVKRRVQYLRLTSPK